MSFLLPLAGSLFSSPLVQSTLGNIASGAISTLKSAATNLLTNGLSTLTNTVNDKVQKINNYNPSWAQPAMEYYNNPDNNGKRKAIMPMDYEEEEDYAPPTRRPRRPRSRTPKRNRRPARNVYNPDLITEYEE